MPTTMEHALQKAGFATKSQSERIWLWLKDHPRKTSTEVAYAVHIDKKNVTSLLAQLRARKMVTSTIDYTRRKLNGRHPTEWVTVGSEYELLPRPRKLGLDLAGRVPEPQVQVVRVAAVPTPAPTPMPTPAPTAAPVADITALVEGLTLKQARSVYKYLHALFQSRT